MKNQLEKFQSVEDLLRKIQNGEILLQPANETVFIAPDAVDDLASVLDSDDLTTDTPDKTTSSLANFKAMQFIHADIVKQGADVKVMLDQVQQERVQLDGFKEEVFAQAQYWTQKEQEIKDNWEQIQTIEAKLKADDAQIGALFDDYNIKITEVEAKEQELADKEQELAIKMSMIEEAPVAKEEMREESNEEVGEVTIPPELLQSKLVQDMITKVLIPQIKAQMLIEQEQKEERGDNDSEEDPLDIVDTETQTDFDVKVGVVEKVDVGVQEDDYLNLMQKDEANRVNEGLRKYAAEVWEKEKAIIAREKAFDKLKQEKPLELYRELNTSDQGTQVSLNEEVPVVKDEMKEERDVKVANSYVVGQKINIYDQLIVDNTLITKQLTLDKLNFEIYKKQIELDRAPYSEHHYKYSSVGEKNMSIGRDIRTLYKESKESKFSENDVKYNVGNHTSTQTDGDGSVKMFNYTENSIANVKGFKNLVITHSIDIEKTPNSYNIDWLLSEKTLKLAEMQHQLNVKNYIPVKSLIDSHIIYGPNLCISGYEMKTMAYYKTKSLHGKTQTEYTEEFPQLDLLPNVESHVELMADGIHDEY